MRLSYGQESRCLVQLTRRFWTKPRYDGRSFLKKLAQERRNLGSAL